MGGEVCVPWNIISSLEMTATDVLSGDTRVLQKPGEVSCGDTVKPHLFSSLYVFPKRALPATTGKRIWCGPFHARNPEEG